MMTIFESCNEACEQAKELANYHAEPWTVWRCGDQFSARRESTRGVNVWPHAEHPIRPVVTYDPDGTEHS